MFIDGESHELRPVAGLPDGVSFSRGRALSDCLSLMDSPGGPRIGDRQAAGWGWGEGSLHCDSHPVSAPRLR
jgi:hypothetical protein